MLTREGAIYTFQRDIPIMLSFIDKEMPTLPEDRQQGFG